MEITVQLLSKNRIELFGPADEHLRIVRARCGVAITARDESVIISGQEQAGGRSAIKVDRRVDL